MENIDQKPTIDSNAVTPATPEKEEALKIPLKYEDLKEIGGGDGCTPGTPPPPPGGGPGPVCS